MNKIEYSSGIIILFLIVIFNADSNGQHGNKNFSLNDTSYASAYFYKALEFQKTAVYDSSGFYFSKAKEIYESLSESYNDTTFTMMFIRCINLSAENLRMQSKFDEAMIKLDEALRLCINKLGENNPVTAQTYSITALVYEQKGNFDKAFELHMKALAVRLNLFGEEHTDVADSYNGLGVINSLKGNNEKAEEYFQKSLSIKRKLLGDEHLQVAVSYNNLGVVFKEQGDYEKALDMNQQALSIRLKLLGEDNPYTASSYSNLGLVYYNLREYEKAVEMHKKSLDIRLKVFGEKHNHVAISYNNLGLANWKLKKYDEALDNHQRSLQIKKQLFGEKHNDPARSYMNIGLVYFDKGNIDSALENYNRSLSIRRELLGEKHYETAQIYQNISEALLHKKEFNEALKNSQRAIISIVPFFYDTSVQINPSIESINTFDLLNVLKTKAKILAEKSEGKDLNDLILAFSTYDLTDMLIEKLRTGYEGEGSKLFLGEITAPVYDKAIETSIMLYNLTGEKKYKEKAFFFSENCKAAVMQDGLAEVRAKQFAGIPSELIDKERQLRLDLAFYDTQLQKEYLKKVKDIIKINECENHLFNLKKNYTDLISDFEKNYPDYYALKYQGKNLSVPDIQKKISSNEALLQYFTGENSIYIFSITKNDFEIYSVKKKDNFNDLVKDFYTSIIKSETEKYIKSANEISKLLVFPVSEKIKNQEKLIIIPHDILFKIPFEALFTEVFNESEEKKNYSSLNYLMKKYDISYHYSAELYFSSLRNDKIIAEENPDKNSKYFIGFAPVFPKDDLAGYTLASNSLAVLSEDLSQPDILRSDVVEGNPYIRIGELKHSEWEVQNIMNLFSDDEIAGSSLAHFYSDATEESFKKEINNYKIIHIATHSFVNENHPDISGIIFAQPEQDSLVQNSDDGILYAGEIYNLDLNAELVVLSSCESGLGKLIKGEGLLAMTRGFLYSGADNIIISLWKIPDKHTSELMVEFYKEMMNKKNYSHSLRQAKLKLIQNETTARPRSWAGFILVGNN